MLKQSEQNTKERVIKCVVWDLDETLWKGTLLEGDDVEVFPANEKLLRLLDGRGILHSIASKNEETLARETLDRFGLTSYFLHPQIGWSPKSDSIRHIAERLNIGLDAIAFVDDQPFEREEVAFHLPSVMCLGPDAIDAIEHMPEFTPKVITAESARRRLIYLEDEQRKTAEAEFSGSPNDFLATLNMHVSIKRARSQDLDRASELTLRTNQFNTTGRSYSAEELNDLLASPVHRLYVIELEDKFGSYGIVGLGLLECDKGAWIIKLLLMSCRVVSRGIGTVFINYLMRLAKQAGNRLLAEICPNEKNRMMQIAYAFAGFRETARDGGLHLLENDLSVIQDTPAYVTLRSED